MKLMRDIRLLFWRKMMETLRNPIYIVISLVTPVLYLFLFAPLLTKLAGVPGFRTGNVLSVFTPGLLVIIAFLNGLFVGYSIIDDVRNGVIERFRVTPTSRFALLAGPVLRDLVNVLVIVALFTAVALGFGFRLHWTGWLVLLVLIALLLMTTASFGYAMGLILKDEDRLSPIVQGVNLPILLLSGMLLPMSLAPGWLQVVAHFNPAYYVVDAARMLCAGHLANAAVWQAFAVMVPLTSVVLLWSTRSFRRSLT